MQTETISAVLVGTVVDQADELGHHHEIVFDDAAVAAYQRRVDRFRRLHARMGKAYGHRYLILLRGMRCGRARGCL